ncbi:MAG: RNA polymerase sigma factor [bacterium]
MPLRSLRAVSAELAAKRAIVASREWRVRLRERDPDALANFFDAHCEWIYALVFRLIGSRDAAEDVSQEVFYRVHRAAHQIDLDQDVEPWLTSVVYNACRDYWRSKTHAMSRQTISIDDAASQTADLRSRDENPEAAVVRRQESRLVQKAISRLPGELRAAIVLYDYHGLGHDEVAALTGVSHAAARKRYSRALSQLARELKRFFS